MTEQSAPAWVVAASDQAFARAMEVVPENHTGIHSMVMLMMTEPREEATREEWERFERTCDNCGTYCPFPVPFWTGAVQKRAKGHVFTVTYGCCQKCKELP